MPQLLQQRALPPPLRRHLLALPAVVRARVRTLARVRLGVRVLSSRATLTNALPAVEQRQARAHVRALPQLLGQFAGRKNLLGQVLVGLQLRAELLLKGHRVAGLGLHLHAELLLKGHRVAGLGLQLHAELLLYG